MYLSTFLPEEILLQIFGETDKSDLQKFLEISHEWRDLLIKNAKVMRKLPLILMNDTWRDKLEFVKSYGKFIRNVEFIETNLESFEDVLSVLNHTPNVEKVSLIKVKIADVEVLESSENDDESLKESSSEITREKLFLSNLNGIVIKDDDNVGSLKFFVDNIEANLINIKCELNDDSQLIILSELLIENHDLKTLEITSKVESTFSPSDGVLELFKFKLQKLTIKASLMKYDEQLFKFLKSQRYLNELGFFADHVDFRYHQLMLTQFPAIRKLHINIDTVATTDCLLKLRFIKQIKLLNSLSLSGRNNHLNIFDAILRICPNITDLTIQNLTQFHSDKIRDLPLTRLRVDCVNCDFLSVGESTKIHLKEIVHTKEVYERNLQNFSNLSRFGDKNKDTAIAYKIAN